MAITNGKPCITQGSGGFLHLAHITRHGTQLSIENFLTLQEARAFCDAHKIKASVAVGGRMLSQRDCAVLLCMASTPATLGDIVTAAKTSVASAKKLLAKWTVDGLAVAGEEQKKPGLRAYWLSPSGEALRAAISS